MCVCVSGRMCICGKTKIETDVYFSDLLLCRTILKVITSRATTPTPVTRISTSNLPAQVKHTLSHRPSPPPLQLYSFSDTFNWERGFFLTEEIFCGVVGGPKGLGPTNLTKSPSGLPVREIFLDFMLNDYNKYN